MVHYTSISLYGFHQNSLSQNITIIFQQCKLHVLVLWYQVAWIYDKVSILYFPDKEFPKCPVHCNEQRNK